MVRRPGRDVTLIAYGGMVATALEAAEAAVEEGWDVEVIDLRSLSPFDDQTLTESVRRTGRAVVVHEAAGFAGYGAEIAARLTEQCFHHLEAPILRVTGLDIPYPPPQLEQYHLPSADRILDAHRPPAVGGDTMPDFLLPDLGEGLARPRSSPGASRSATTSTVDQVIAEVETAKAVVEVPVPYAGVVADAARRARRRRRRRAAADHRHRGRAGGGIPRARRRHPGPRPRPAAAPPRASGSVLIGYGTTAAPPAGSAAPGSAAPPGGAGAGARPAPGPAGFAVISPLVRKMARDAGLDLTSVTGTGPAGVVSRQDVRQAIAERAYAAAASARGPGRPRRGRASGGSRCAARGARRRTS